MRARTTTLRGLGFACFALATLSLGAAQQAPTPPDTPQEIFVGSVDVNVVNVDVYVTDEQGSPVPGLTIDDFEIEENGRRVAITNFYAVDGRKPVKPEPTEAPAPPTEETSADTVPDDQRLHLIVYIDNFNLRPFNRNRVLTDLRTFLRSESKPGDRVMLVSYDRSLKIRRPFTTDVESVIDALFELDEVSAQGVHSDSDKRDAVERINRSESAQEALSWARSFADSAKNDLQFTIGALRDIVGSMAGLGGRKAVVYVSDGLPMSPGEDLFYLVDQKYPNNGAISQVFSYDTSRRFEELAALANANRVSFYTIDAAGLRVNSSADVQKSEASPGTATFIDSMAIQNLQAPLRMLAERTGGFAVINRNRFKESLTRIGTDFRSFYSLAYSPAHSGDGRYYKIEVKLKNPQKGWKIRHREGYRDKSSESQMTDGVLAALQFPYASNPLDLTVTFGRPQAQEKLFLVPVEVKVPFKEIVLVQRGELYEARAKLFVAAIDGESNTSPVQQIDLPIRIPAAEIEAALKQEYTYTVSLLMRGGSQKVAVGLRDEIAGANSFVSRTVRVP
ncbi:MAG: VWA domain-containing protein [Thermoanaerobaculia bacterium]|nr:VWA domain-containing protein [Thermoanaerobaculia bacterium]